MSTTSSRTPGSASATSTVGHVTKIERQGWHALVTMRLNGDVELPANATAKIGQTSLLGSLHIELAPPTDAAAGRPAARRIADPAVARRRPTRPPSRRWPRVSMVLNGGGLGQIQDITEAFSTAFRGREQDLRSLISELDRFAANLNDQTDDIIAATESLNNLVGSSPRRSRCWTRRSRPFPMRWPCSTTSARTSPTPPTQLGKFSALAADTVEPDQGQSGQGAQRHWAGAGIAGQRRPGPDPGAEPDPDVPVPERDHREVAARRLRQPDRDHRPDAQPDRPGAVHRHPVGGQPDRAGDAVGPHHRPVPQPVHRGQPAWSRPTTSIRGPEHASDSTNADPAGGLHVHRVDGDRGDEPAVPQAARQAVRHRPLHRDHGAAGDRRPLRQRQRHLPRHRGRPGAVGRADRHRCAGGAVAEVGHRHSVGSEGRGAQPVGDR